MQDQRRWRAEMEAQSPVSGEDDSTTASNQSDEEEKEEEEKEEEEEDPVEREEGCKKKLAEAKALSKPTLCTIPVEHADKPCSQSP